MDFETRITDRIQEPNASQLEQVALLVGVFCSAAALPERYTIPARQFATALGEKGYSLVWGGSDTGLMSEVATYAQYAGARIIGVSVEFLKHYAHKNADEMIVARDHSERKEIMLSRSDVLVAMVGGIGTLDEITEVAELKKHRKHAKTIIALNTEGFYDGLKQQLETMEREGLLPIPLGEIMQFVDTPEEAISMIDSFRLSSKEQGLQA